MIYPLKVGITGFSIDGLVEVDLVALLDIRVVIHIYPTSNSIIVSFGLLMPG